MDKDSFYSSLTTELERWQSLRKEGVANLETETSDEGTQALRKSLTGEYNSHVRRVDSLWRQFIDDHKRANGLLNL